MAHQVGSVPPIHLQHPTKTTKGQETAGQTPPGLSCRRPVPCRAQAASPAWDLLSSWLGKQQGSEARSLLLSCPVAAVHLPGDCCRAESCRSFYDGSLRERLHQPQRRGKAANEQQGAKLPMRPRVPMEAGSHRNDSMGHIK